MKNILDLSSGPGRFSRLLENGEYERNVTMLDMSGKL